MKTNTEKIIPFVIKQMETAKEGSTSYSHLQLTDEEIKDCSLLPTTNKVNLEIGNFISATSKISCKLRNNIVCLKLVK